MRRAILFALAFVCIVAFLFKETAFANLLELVIERKLGEEVTYKRRDWEGGKLVYTGLRIGSGVAIEQAVFDVSLHRAPLYLEGHLYLKRPEFTVAKGEPPLLV